MSTGVPESHCASLYYPCLPKGKAQNLICWRCDYAFRSPGSLRHQRSDPVLDLGTYSALGMLTSGIPITILREPSLLSCVPLVRFVSLTNSGLELRENRDATLHSPPSLQRCDRNALRTTLRLLFEGCTAPPSMFTTWFCRGWQPCPDAGPNTSSSCWHRLLSQ